MSRQRGGQVPWQKFLQAIHRMVGDAIEHVTQVQFRIDTVELRGAKQRVDRSSTFASSSNKLLDKSIASRTKAVSVTLIPANTIFFLPHRQVVADQR